MSIKIGLEADTLEEAEQIMKWWHQPGPTESNGTGRTPRKATVTRISRHEHPPVKKQPCPRCGGLYKRLKTHLSAGRCEIPPEAPPSAETASPSESDNKGEG